MEKCRAVPPGPDRRALSPKPADVPENPPDDAGWLDRGADDTDLGWHEATDQPGRRDDDWYLRERPPHHGD